MNKGTPWRDIIAVFVIVLLALYLFSCNTAKQDLKNVNKAIIRNPVPTAKRFNEVWPCVPVATVSDSTEYKKYLQDLKDLNDYYASHQPETVPVEADTIIKIWQDSVKIKYYVRQLAGKDLKIKALNSQLIDVMKLCEDKPPLHDTVKIDGPKLFIIAKQLEESESEKAALQKKVDSKSSWLNIWRLIALGLIGYTGLRFYLKSKLKILP